MQLQEASVLTHYTRRHERDYATLKDNSYELLEEIADVGLETFGVRTTLKNMLYEDGEDRKQDPDGIMPLTSINLLRASYSAIRSSGSKINKNMAGFVGGTLLDITGLSPGEPAASGNWGYQEINACGDAETQFGVTLEQTKRPHPNAHSQLRVYHGKDRTPLLWRKANEKGSALTLVPIELDKLLIPAGTIVGVGHTMSRKATGEHQPDSNTTFRTYRAPKTLNITPRRLSPWAFDEPLDRAMFAVRENGDGELYYDQDRAASIVPYSIDDFRQAADEVILACAA